MKEIKRKARIASNLHLKFKRGKVIFMTVLLFVLTIVVTQIITVQVKNSERYNETIQTQQRYYLFQHEVEGLMNTAADLVQGYGALYNMDPDLTVEESETYLAFLISDFSEYVRNVAILDDTTIIFNYPYELNKSTIGTDLATIEGQKEAVLKVKNELTTILIGPIDLIQGGRGYIVRSPLVDEKGAYWGQIATVLIAEVINDEILSIAEKEELDIVIYQDSTKKEPIIGDPMILSNEPMSFENVTGNDWIIYVVPQGGWTHSGITSRILFVFGIVLAMFFSMTYVLYNITEYRLGYALTHDSLTNLYNRRYLEIVQQALTSKSDKSRKDYGLFHIDLDNFKYINDNFGHLKGDEVLQQIGEILQHITRKDELVFRIGGDEFLIMIPETKKDDELIEMRKRFLRDFHQAFDQDEHLSMLDVSIGIAVYPKEGQDFDAVLKIADIDMYDQKRMNKSRKKDR